MRYNLIYLALDDSNIPVVILMQYSLINTKVKSYEIQICNIHNHVFSTHTMVYDLTLDDYN